MIDPKSLTAPTGRLVRLLDGTVVDSSSERRRHECEARAISSLPTLAERRAWLDDVEHKRGRAAADALRGTIAELWQQEQ